MIEVIKIMCEERAEDLSGSNLYNDPVIVKHAELERENDVSIFRSICPVCKKGMLLVRRNQKTLRLEAEDNCILCGQHFYYSDIEELRNQVGE